MKKVEELFDKILSIEEYLDYLSKLDDSNDGYEEYFNIIDAETKEKYLLSCYYDIYDEDYDNLDHNNDKTVRITKYDENDRMIRLECKEIEFIKDEDGIIGFNTIIEDGKKMNLKFIDFKHNEIKIPLYIIDDNSNSLYKKIKDFLIDDGSAEFVTDDKFFVSELTPRLILENDDVFFVDKDWDEYMEEWKNNYIHLLHIIDKIKIEEDEIVFGECRFRTFKKLPYKIQ